MKKKWISMLLICLIAFSSVSALADWGAIVKKNAKVYRDAGLKRCTGALPKYTSVAVLATQGNKAMIKSRGTTLYIRKSALRWPWSDAEIWHSSVKKNCYVYDYPSRNARKLAKVKKGATVIEVCSYGGWTMVKNPNNAYYGYIRSSNLE